MKKHYTWKQAMANPFNKKIDLSDKKTVILTLVSSMCDNISYLKLHRKDEDIISVRLSNDHTALSLSNIQMDMNTHNPSEMLKWAFLDNDLKELVKIVNGGTSKVCDIQCR